MTKEQKSQPSSSSKIVNSNTRSSEGHNGEIHIRESHKSYAQLPTIQGIPPVPASLQNNPSTIQSSVSTSIVVAPAASVPAQVSPASGSENSGGSSITTSSPDNK